MRKPRTLHPNGFTLIELMVVIAVVGLLASTVMANVQTARQRSVIARTNVEFNELKRAVFVAETTARLPLISITGNNCSDCACRTGLPIHNLPDSDPCVVAWVAALTDIAAASNGTFPDLTRFTRDPWGAPYLLDENESETVANPCVRNTLRSAGPNNIVGDSDDMRIDLPFYSPNCAS